MYSYFTTVTAKTKFLYRSLPFCWLECLLIAGVGICHWTLFNILQFVTVSNSNTRSSDKLTLKHTISFSNQQRHFYFNRIPRLWNSLPPIDLDLSSQTIRTKIKTFLWEQFLNKFVSNCPCTFHFKCPCSRCSYISISRYSK